MAVCSLKTQRQAGYTHKKMGWCRRAFLPSANALIPLAVAMHGTDGKWSDRDVLNYRRWLCLSALRTKLKNVESAINSCLREMRDKSPKELSAALFQSLGKGDSRKIKTAELDDAAPMWGATTQIMYAWLVDIGTKDWELGKTLDELAREGGIASRTGKLSVHHIFPREVLAQKFEPWAANWASNYAILSGSTNSAIKATPPDEVLKQLAPEMRKYAAVQLFGDNAGDRLTDYEAFRKWRAEQLTKALNGWLELS